MCGCLVPLFSTHGKIATLFILADLTPVKTWDFMIVWVWLSLHVRPDIFINLNAICIFFSRNGVLIFFALFLPPGWSISYSVICRNSSYVLRILAIGLRYKLQIFSLSSFPQGLLWKAPCLSLSTFESGYLPTCLISSVILSPMPGVFPRAIWFTV